MESNRRDLAGWIGACIFFAIVAVDVVYGMVKRRDSLVTWIDVSFGAFAIFSLFAHQITEFAISDKGVTIKQTPSPEATNPGGKAAKALAIVAPEGFLSEEGIKQIVAESNLIERREHIVRALLIFSTDTQRTWLVATNRQLFCLLDDEDTRRSGRMMQWVLPLAKATPVNASSYGPTTGVLDIGPRSDWLYSRRLHPNARKLERAVRQLIEEASHAKPGAVDRPRD